MQLDTYYTKINEQRELELMQDSLVDVLKYYILFADVVELSFFKYDYELNNYNYEFSVKDNEKFIKKHSYDSKKYSIILEKDKAIFGMLTFDEKPKDSHIEEELFKKIIIVLEKIFLLEKNLISQESTLDIFIITDENSKSFAKKLENNLSVLLNAKIEIKSTVDSITDILKTKIKKSILIYTIDDQKILKKDEKTLQSLNEFLLVIGPSDFDLPLYCGNLKVNKYLSKDQFLPEQIKTIILELHNTLQNKYLNANKIIAVSGIAGGIGTTTVSMNIANILAKKNYDKNILYIDLSLTKAISNLFLEKNPLPKKTIIDLVNSSTFDIEKNLETGLVKIRENFYAINGIQKHIDSDYLEQDIFIEKFLEYISKISDKFNYIIIDTGETTASKLNSTIYDIANNLWILTEMSLPHISKLKTFFSLIKRAGLKEKLTFLVNRYDSKYAISVSDVTSILNTENDEHLNFEFKIPNDYQTLGYCWNYCELVSDSFPNCTFVQKLEQILLSTNCISSEHTTNSKKASWFSFLQKDEK